MKETPKNAAEHHSVDAPAETGDWDRLVLSAGDADYMQSAAWGESKSLSHWPFERVVVKTERGEVPLQIAHRSVPGLGRVHYAANVAGVSTANVATITAELRQRYASDLAFKLELYQPYDEALIAALQGNGWRRTKQIQYRTTVDVDLSGAADELLARLKRRARYEVRAAEKSGVTVEKAEVNESTMGTLMKLMNTTAKRSGAFFRSAEFITNYWQAFARTGQAHFYFAKHEGDILAGAFVITYGNHAWYKDGGSVREKGNVFAPRYLQWGIMKDLQARGIKHYDLCGIPAPEDVESSPAKGLYAFKTGFSNDITRLMPVMELPLSWRYLIWQKLERWYLRLYSGLTNDFWY